MKVLILYRMKLKHNINSSRSHEIHLHSTGGTRTDVDCRPTLAGLAEKYLAITATSTPAERIFSVAGLIVSQLRASLTPEHVDMLVLLNKNMGLNLK